MSEGKVRVIIKRPDEEFGHVTNISPSLKNLQNTVGGYIEMVTLHTFSWGDRILIICDEEGRLKGKEHNCGVAGIDFVGDIICAASNAEGELIDLKMDFAHWEKLITQKGDF